MIADREPQADSRLIVKPMRNHQSGMAAGISEISTLAETKSALSSFSPQGCPSCFVGRNCDWISVTWTETGNIRTDIVRNWDPEGKTKTRMSGGIDPPDRWPCSCRKTCAIVIRQESARLAVHSAFWSFFLAPLFFMVIGGEGMALAVT
ncbi:hypothetical protein ASPWEDRAFT_369180 [Aspergillus wentii DTO 134E9]|uniref:Uncharacterized protein n=1 Tax=Aspergillus wentii DTO 134E9 TaxID=1073089 RepID=A0A1L9RWR5_ASPWE|nr:uncharacterized protein ASPWEDRAFT_369180 [Aspergillus wentii DTO 134E9]OJJ39333.1 hypothetical protein ASPWEDRAFT_369180 [Aspergillus wentii DTO 134E9]